MDSIGNILIKELKTVEKENWRVRKELKRYFLNKILNRITVVEQIWLKIKSVFVECTEQLIGLRKPT